MEVRVYTEGATTTDIRALRISVSKLTNEGIKAEHQSPRQDILQANGIALGDSRAHEVLCSSLSPHLEILSPCSFDVLKCFLKHLHLYLFLWGNAVAEACSAQVQEATSAQTHLCPSLPRTRRVNTPDRLPLRWLNSDAGLLPWTPEHHALWPSCYWLPFLLCLIFPSPYWYFLGSTPH